MIQNMRMEGKYMGSSDMRTKVRIRDFVFSAVDESLVKLVTFKYGYDAMNRLTVTNYIETTRSDNKNMLSSVGTHVYDSPTYRTLYTYDLNSNPTAIVRCGPSEIIAEQDTSSTRTIYRHTYDRIDHLLLSYSGNRLIKVSDRGYDCIYEGATDFADNASESVEYTYDSNGNMTSDLNKGIENIEYNVQNLPQTIIFSDGHRIHYSYDSDGNKLRVIYSIVSENVFTSEDGEITSGEESEDEWERSSVELQRTYIDEFVYESGTLERILTPNGYYKNGCYYFYIRDYQGNNRVTVNSSLRADTSTSGTVVQSNVISSSDAQAYYPYGVRFADVFKSNTDRYRYGGKEFDVLNDLQLYDFSARHYDPQLGRFTSPDPLQEKYYHLSPYLYCAANPIRNIDPTGKVIKLTNGLSIEQIYTVLGNLQQLTNDKLVYKTMNDGSIRIKIASLGEGNLINGTNLIRSINSSKNVVTIDVNNSSNLFSKSKGNYSKPLNSDNSMNGIGSDAIITFDPEFSPDIPILNAEGKVVFEKRPAKIGLAHELIHSLHIIEGSLISPDSETNHVYINSDGNSETQKVRKEELRTIGIGNTTIDGITENKIREEHGLKKRGAY